MKPLALILFASGLCFGQEVPKLQPSALELTIEQKLAFQTALANLWKQWGISVNLQAQVEANHKALQDAQRELTLACPGDIVGMDKNDPQCKPKAKPEEKPQPSKEK